MDLLRIQCLQASLQVLVQVFWSVCPSVGIQGSAYGRVEFGVHDQSAVLPVDLPQVFFRRAATVDTCGVDLVVAMRLKDVEYLVRLVE